MLVLFVVCLYAKIHTSPDIVRVLVLGFSFYFVSCSETDYIQYMVARPRTLGSRLLRDPFQIRIPPLTTTYYSTMLTARSNRRRRNVFGSCRIGCLHCISIYYISMSVFINVLMT